MAQAEWEEFVESVPWFLWTGASVEVGDSTVASSAAMLKGSEFPTLHRLLSEAVATPVQIDDEEFELLTWLTSDGTRLSWLCMTPSNDPPKSMCPPHRRLIACFGGVVERSSNEPQTWLLNCNDALTEREAHHDASFLDQHVWTMEGHDRSWPIESSVYYSICREANGNTTLCNRDDGSILLYAGDHFLDDIAQVAGAPPYSLSRIPEAPDFPSWVDAVANQWIDAID